MFYSNFIIADILQVNDTLKFAIQTIIMLISVIGSFFIIYRSIINRNQEKLDKKVDKIEFKDKINKLELRQRDLEVEFHDNIQHMMDKNDRKVEALSDKIDENHKIVTGWMQSIYKILLKKKEKVE